jgi:Fe2+ or Zn2+ uptake regulation protein
LEAAGLVSIAHRGPPRALYEITGRGHDHFICRVCGDVIDVDVARRRRPPPPLPGAVVEGVDITYRGECGPCAAG